MNDDKVWSNVNYFQHSVYDVMSIALHEVGHSLGINHYVESSDIPQEIPTMSAYYMGIVRDLHYDDVLAIWDLYGRNFDIISSDNVTNGSTNAFKISIPAPREATIQWIGDANMTIVSGQGTQTATFKSNSTHNGCSTIKAIMMMGKTAYEVEKKVWIGDPMGSITINNGFKNEYVEYESISLTYTNTISKGTLEVKTTGPCYATINNGKIMAQSTSLNGSTYEPITIQAFIKHDCGTIYSNTWRGSVVGGRIDKGNGAGQNIVATSLSLDDPTFSIKVYSFPSGALVHQEKDISNFNIQNTSLKKGIYFIETTKNDGIIEREKAIKKIKTIPF